MSAREKKNIHKHKQRKEIKKIMDYLNNYYCSENNKEKNKIYESLNLSKQTKTKHVSVMEKKST